MVFTPVGTQIKAGFAMCRFIQRITEKLYGDTPVIGKEYDVAEFGDVPVQLLDTGPRLKRLGIHPRNFTGEETIEPSVIGWMPSAQLYFTDPNGHSLEYIALLDDPPDAAFIGPLSEWQKRF